MPARRRSRPPRWSASAAHPRPPPIAIVWPVRTVQRLSPLRVAQSLGMAAAEPAASGDGIGWRRGLGHPVAISALVTALGAVGWLAVFPRAGTRLSPALAQ